MFDNDSYYEDVSIFKKILSKEADNLLDNEENTYIYVGRATCPYCRKFVKKLNSAATKTSAQIYYVNSENSSDDNLKSFRDKYNVLTVPGFIIKKNSEIDVKCDSSIPEEELVNIIK